jgi:hypothetical protein
MTSREEFVEAMKRMDGLCHAAMRPAFQGEAFSHLRAMAMAFARESCPEKKCTGYCRTALLRDCGLEETP